MGSETNTHLDTRVSESQVLAQIANAVIVIDFEERVLFWNRAAELLYGRSASEMVAQPLTTAYRYKWPNGERPEDVLEAIRQAGAWSGENLHVLHDGRRLIVRSQVRSFSDNQGQPLGYIAVIHDITGERLQQDAALLQRNLAAEQLALSENRYRSLVNASAQIVWTCPPNGQQTGEDMPGWQMFTGQNNEEMAGYGWANAIHPDDREVNVQLWNHAIATCTPCEFEQRLRRYDGVYRNMHVRAVPVRNSVGEIVEWVGMTSDITARKMAEAALRQINSRFRRLFDSDLVGVEISDKAGNTLDANNCFLEIIGYSREDLEEGRVRWRDMTPPEYAALDDAGIAEVARRGSCTPYEKEYIRKDGGRVPILIGYARLEDSQDVYVCLILNLSRQKQAEADLRRSERLYRSIGESIEYGVWVCDADGRNTYASDSFLKLVGLTQEQCSEFGWSDVLHPDDAERTTAHWKECARTGGNWDIEHRFRGTDGKWHDVLARGVPVRDERGTVTAWAGINLDISRIKEAEAALREREHRFHVLAESLPQLIWVADAAGQDTYSNQRFSDYTGIAHERLMATEWRDIVYPDDLSVTTERWQHSVATGEPYLTEFRLRRRDGEYRHFLARAVPLKNDSGEIEQWIGTATDVHDQKLSEQSLRRSEKLATAGRLAATLAHEINNPLEAVDNALYVALHDKGLAAPSRECLELATEELRRIIRLTAQTLGFHKQSPSPELVDLEEVISSACSLFHHRIKNANVKVTIDARTHQPLHCYRDDLRQVFANLIGNALDAVSRDGAVKVRIRFGSSWREPHELGLRVTLADNGCGIPISVKQNLFQPFFTTKEMTGTGLGLWVSEGIIRKHRGHIAVRTNTDSRRHGTVFSIFLPLDGVARSV